MSYGEKRPLSQIEPIAEGLVGRLKPFCERIEIAGSVRRRTPRVGDIEIVAIPVVIDHNDLFGDLVRQENQLHDYLDHLLSEQKISHSPHKRWGSKMRSFCFEVQSGLVKVDLFMCMPSTWGSTLLIRTGSADFSRFMVTQRAQGGALPNGYQHHNNHVFRPGMEPVPMPEEKSFFELCEIPVVPPTERQDGLWYAWLAEEGHVFSN